MAADGAGVGGGSRRARPLHPPWRRQPRSPRHPRSRTAIAAADGGGTARGLSVSDGTRRRPDGADPRPAGWRALDIATRPNRPFDETARSFFERDWPDWLTGRIFDLGARRGIA